MKSDQKFAKWTDKIKTYYLKSDKFTIFDWILFIVLAGFCFLSYVHPDLLATGNRSWVFYDGIRDFYDNAAAWTRDNGANYMPSTFALFAIWNLPLKLLGIDGPSSIIDSRIELVIWYKILPLLFFAGSAWMIYRVAKEIGLESHKAKVTMFAFMTMPLCFFSQFIFSQYDIFTVFFMLWGMYYYYRNKECDMWRFALLFGVAVTFKYFAVVLFFVFLLVREKKVWNIIKYIVGAMLPFGAEYLLYQGSTGFQQGVFEFGALDYVSNTVMSTGFASFSYTKTGCVIMACWAWFVYAKDKKEEVAWTLYLSCGACFVIFGFCIWHPQWLMFMAPFWVLSTCINVHQEKFLWIEAGLTVVFQLLCASLYEGNVDVSMMQYLVWKDIFQTGGPWYFISDVLPDLGTNTIYSVFTAVLLVMFLFKHPKYIQKDLGEKDTTDHMHLIRLRMILVVAVFSVPAFVAAYVNTITQSVSLTNTSSCTEWIDLTEGVTVEQELPEVGRKMHRISFYGHAEAEENASTFTMDILDGNGDVVYTHIFTPQEINNVGYTNYYLENDLILDSEQSYTIRLYSTDGTQDDCYAVGAAKKAEGSLELDCEIDGHNSDYIAGIEYVLQYDGWKDAKENGR